LWNERLSQSQNSLLGSNSASLEQQEVVLDDSVMWESSHWVDGLLGEIGLGGSGLLVSGLSDSVDLLVDLGSVMVSVLSSTWNREGNTGWMPGSDTGDLTESLVSLTWKSGGSPSGGNSLKSVSLGDSDDIDLLVLVEDGVD